MEGLVGYCIDAASVMMMYVDLQVGIQQCLGEEDSAVRGSGTADIFLAAGRFLRFVLGESGVHAD